MIVTSWPRLLVYVCYLIVGDLDFHPLILSFAGVDGQSLQSDMAESHCALREPNLAISKLVGDGYDTWWRFLPSTYVDINAFMPDQFSRSCLHSAV